MLLKRIISIIKIETQKNSNIKEVIEFIKWYNREALKYVTETQKTNRILKQISLIVIIKMVRLMRQSFITESMC